MYIGNLLETIPILRSQLSLAARRVGTRDAAASRRLAGLIDGLEEFCSAEAQCEPERTPEIVSFFVDCADADKQYGLGIAQGVMASRRSLSRVVKRSLDAPRPGTVPTWAAVFHEDFLRGAFAEARERAASCV